MDQLLIDLINSYGVSGREDEIRDLIKKHLVKNNVKFYEDSMKNIIVKMGNGKEKMMLCSHMDSIGFIVSHISENGMIIMDSIGQFKKEYVNNGFIRFENGVLGKVSLNKTNIVADIGLDSKEGVLDKIKEGDTASLVGPYLIVENNNIISPTLYNKVGCYILLKLIDEMKDDKIQDKEFETYFVFSSQGEIGGAGARSAARQIKPNYAIIVGTKEDISKENVSIGKGPVLRIMDKSLIMHEEVKKMLEEAAIKSNVAIQHSISTDRSEGGSVHKEFSGIPTGEIDIPCRYKYSISEMVSLDDIDREIKLLKQLTRKVLV
ncbi:M42 family peptidase [Clostridium sp. cel8]|jgi:tetrahedral aminopeptidase|uniref:M42 family peptidase n=1 Tax=unclassified Clostridium TaxID=2614128 RepID=UPI0015F46DCE|nr:M42 family peptidase [Clostridium sp. cel8]MBA5852036.1 M42 family peptidase [Clostridium sp. cel8]